MGRVSSSAAMAIILLIFTIPPLNGFPTSFKPRPKTVWERLRDIWDSLNEPPRPPAAIQLRRSLYSTDQIAKCGGFFCETYETCSHNVSECAALHRPYGPPCCLGKGESLKSVSDWNARQILRDSPPRDPAPIVMGDGGYGTQQRVAFNKKSIFDRCVDEIKAAAGPGFDYEKMHATLRIISKLAEAKFRGIIANKKKDIEYNEPVYDVDVIGLKDDIDTISPCSGFLYQTDILLQEDQMELIIENAVVYVGDVLRDMDLEDIFAPDELELLNKSPALRSLRQPAAPCPPYNPCTQDGQILGGIKDKFAAETGQRTTSFNSNSGTKFERTRFGAPGLSPDDWFLTEEEEDEGADSAKINLSSRTTIGELSDAFISHREKREIQSDKRGRWSLPIRYRTDKGVNSGLVESGIKRWKDATCLTFKKTTLATRKIKGNFLNFVKGDGCHSMVGRNMKGEGQSVSLGTGCESIGTVSHEVGHALGLWHEQARPDRDDSVKVLSKNIPDKYLGQFLVQDFKTQGVPYDYGSIMHYSSKAYVKSAKLFSITQSYYKQTMGQRDMLSFLDIKVVNQAYCKSTCKKSLKCENGGYTDPKNCKKCRCPGGLGGTCGEPLKTGSSCGTITLKAGSSWKTLKQSGKKECNYLIKASGNIDIEVENPDFKCTKICEHFVEVKYLKLMGPTGARLCCKRGTEKFQTKGKMAVILYRGDSGHSMTLKYKA